MYLVTGSDDGSVLKWQVSKDADVYRTRLEWGSTNGSLSTAGASIQDVRGLSRVNKELMKQRGAIGEPKSILREAGKKLLTMASALSNLKQTPHDTVPESSSAASHPDEQPSQLIEQPTEEQSVEEQVGHPVEHVDAS
jgi:hypothetical protein